MQRACLWIISAILTALGVFAVGDEAAAQNLKGAYGFTGTADCLVAPGSSMAPQSPGNTTPYPNAGFNPDQTPIDGQVFRFSFSACLLDGLKYRKSGAAAPSWRASRTYARCTSPHNSANERSCSSRFRMAKSFTAAALSMERSAQEKNFSSICSLVNGTCGVPLA
jgi:hypothetical protein